MNATFVIPSRIHPPHSVLGRGICMLVEDARRAESFYIVTVSLGAVFLVLSQFLAWSALQPLSDEGLQLFATAEAAAAVLFVLTCVAGRQPEAVVHVDDDGLHVQRGRDTVSVRFTDVADVSIIDAALYHRHYSRYRITRSFVNRVYPRLLLISTASGPVVLGVTPPDAGVVRRLLLERTAAEYTASRAGAA